MSLSKIIHQWGVTMAKVKRAIEHLSEPKEMNIEFVPIYISKDDFQKKKSEVQTLIARMLVSAQKRGRPSKHDLKEINDAA
jgi:hypothetical protein